MVDATKFPNSIVYQLISREYNDTHLVTVASVLDFLVYTSEPKSKVSMLAISCPRLFWIPVFPRSDCSLASQWKKHYFKLKLVVTIFEACQFPITLAINVHGRRLFMLSTHHFENSLKLAVESALSPPA